MKIPSNVINFAGEANINVYRQFRDYFMHYRGINGAKGLEYQTVKSDGTAITFSDKEDAMNAALRKEVFRVAGVQNFADLTMDQWSTNPMISWATFAVVSAMVDMVLPETILESIGLYADVRTIGWGDSAAFDIKPRDLFVVSKAGKNQRTGQIQKQFNGQVTLVPEMHEVTVGMSLYRILCGKDSLAEFTAKAVRSIETAMTIDAYTAFNTAMTNLSTTTSLALKVAGYTQSSLVDLAQKVSTYNAGNRAIIVGTPVALLSVLPDDANYRYTLDSEYVKMGYVRTINGFDVLSLAQVADWQNPFSLVLDNSRIYIISPSAQKLVKVVIEGNTMANTTQPYQFANLTQSTTLWKSWTAGVATNSIAGLITLS